MKIPLTGVAGANRGRGGDRERAGIEIEGGRGGVVHSSLFFYCFLFPVNACNAG